jgi:hypothetical protein
MSTSLPYHCPTLKADYFKLPCEVQVAAAKTFRVKFPHAVMPYGPEQCLKCGGKDLVTRVEHDNLSHDKVEHVEVEQGKVLDAAPMIISETANEVEKINTVTDFQNERQNMTEIMIAPRCPKHPNEPQVQCGPDSKRAGQYLGACLVCMAERRVGRKGKDSMTPAVARDLGKGGLTSVKSAVVFKDEAEAERVLGPGKVPAATVAVAEDTPLCKNPDCPSPGSPAKIDKLGRSMGLCLKCLSARGRKVGIGNYERGITSAPVSIPLNQAKYAEIKAWLETQAAENERTLQAEIMYRLKIVMREANTHG